MPHPSPAMSGPRKRALEIGTNPQGFQKAPDYDVQGGHPVNEKYDRREYKEQPYAVQSVAESKGITPFKLGG